MTPATQQTDKVVKQHLNAFALNLGIDALMQDYDEQAVFIAPGEVYRGKSEIRGFFEGFLANLPEGAREHFKLHSRLINDELAYIVWSVADQVPMGTDTFVVRNNKIVQQTFAMYAA